MSYGLDFVYYVLPIVAVSILIGIISWPLSALIFNRSRDGGYTYGIILGFFSIAYIYFTLGHLGLMSLSYSNLFLSFGIWTIINFVIEIKFKSLQRNFNLRNFLAVNIVFLLAVSFWTWVRGFSPDIHDIERFMDYGILKSIEQSQTLPIEDFWMSGLNLNYYYFSHFLVFVLTKLSFLSTNSGFLMAISWNFGLLTIGSFAIGRDLFAIINTQIQKSQIKEIVAGVLSAFLVVLAGNLHILKWIQITIFELIGYTADFYWYADGTRIIADTITEMPIYGLSIADNHPHVWGVFLGILIVAILFHMWFSNYNNVEQTLKHVIPIGFVLALAYLTNTWDILTLGMLISFFLIFKFYPNPLYLTGTLLYIPLSVILLIYPWSRYIQMPISGIGIVNQPSIVIEWLIYWGGLVGLILASLRAFKFPKLEIKNLGLFIYKITQNKPLMFYMIIFVVVLGFWIGIEIFFIKDLLAEGQWYRANTVFKISSQLWLWIALLLGPSIVLAITRFKSNIWVFISTNFIFWVLLVISLVIFKTDNVDSFTYKYPQQFGIILLFISIAIGYILRFLAPKIGDSILLGSITIIISLVGLSSFQLIKQAHGLEIYKGIGNGFEWFKNTYPDDYNIAVFLSTQPKGNIVEGAGSSFKDNNYYSVYLGWPTIIGWDNHEWTWRGSYTPVGERKAEVQEIYTGTDIEITNSIITKYNIQYIVIGSAEQRIYESNINYSKLYELATPIFHSNESVVLKTR